MVLIWQWQKRKLFAIVLSFRPLTGIMVLIDFNINDEYFRFDVSVPLRGLWFLSSSVLWSIHQTASLFPSPYGDCGSYLRGQTFPLLWADEVSVPLRGLWFLSVPSYDARLEVSPKFPSPYGDCGSYLAIRRFYLTILINCFRPFTGIMVLIQFSGFIQSSTSSATFPSPYGDYGSYHAGRQTQRITSKACFRPLTGIMVLIRNGDGRIRNNDSVSVPLRGLWFLSKSRSSLNRQTYTKFPSPYGDYGSYPHPL